MKEEERYLFDLMGFLVVENVLTGDEVAELNRLIDSYDLWEKAKAGEEGAWWNDSNFMTVGSLHTWDEPFRRLLARPDMVPYLVELLGSDYRYDHGHVLCMHQGSDPLVLHGGGNAPGGGVTHYDCHNGQMHNGLLVVSYALTDAGPTDGGFAVVPGSHKANFSLPSSFVTLEREGQWVLRVPAKAGDAIIFTEACTHGTWPWTAQHERRNLLYKYTPSHIAYAGPPYPTPDDAPHISYPEELRRILRAPNVSGPMGVD